MPFSLSTLSAMLRMGGVICFIAACRDSAPCSPRSCVPFCEGMVQHALPAHTFLEVHWLPENDFGRMPWFQNVWYLYEIGLIVCVGYTLWQMVKTCLNTLLISSNLSTRDGQTFRVVSTMALWRVFRDWYVQETILCIYLQFSEHGVHDFQWRSCYRKSACTGYNSVQCSHLSQTHTSACTHSLSPSTPPQFTPKSSHISSNMWVRVQCAQTHTQTRTHTHIDTHTHTPMHTQMHTHAHTRAHPHTHTHAHMHAHI